MVELTLTIEKKAVYDEVSQTTSYTGAKMEGDDGKEAYERIYTTDQDRSQLERFWNESCVAVCEALKRFLSAESNTAEGFSVSLSLSSSYDTALTESMKKELFSFFVMNITAKWYTFTNKKEAGEYATAALAFLDGVKRKACYKKKPSRPTYN